MALTALITPEQVTPAYNEQLLVLTSTNSGQTGFEYIVTIYPVKSDYSGLDNPIRLRKSPDPNGKGVFDLSKITADFVDSDFNGMVDQFERNSNTQRSFYYSTSATWSGGNETGPGSLYQSFNGVINVEDWIAWDKLDTSFKLTEYNSQGFLTNYRNLQKSKLDECGFLYMQSEGISTITGSELVTNGTFATNLNGWTLSAPGAFTWDNGFAKSDTTLLVTYAAAIGQTISVTAGKYYELSFDSYIGKGLLFVGDGSSAFSATFYAKDSSTQPENLGNVRALYKATSSSITLTFTFLLSENYQYMTLDNVSLKEVEILPYSAEIKTYDSSNTLINTFVLKNNFTYDQYGILNYFTFNYDHVGYYLNDQSRWNSWRIPAGAKNLNLIDNSLLTTGSQPIVTSSVKYWEIKVKTSNGNLYGSYKGYLNDACSKYKSFRLHWLNRLGGMDSFTFDLASQEDINIQREFYNRLMSRDYDYSSNKSYGYTTREETQYHTQYKTAYSVASNWITEEESNMLAELMTSPNVYWEKDADNNKFIPINIKQNTYRKQSKTANNTKVFNLEFQFEVSYNEKIQGR